MAEERSAPSEDLVPAGALTHQATEPHDLWMDNLETYIPSLNENDPLALDENLLGDLNLDEPFEDDEESKKFSALGVQLPASEELEELVKVQIHQKMNELKASIVSANDFYAIHEVEEESLSESGELAQTALQPEVKYEYISPLSSAAHSRNPSKELQSNTGTFQPSQPPASAASLESLFISDSPSSCNSGSNTAQEPSPPPRRVPQLLLPINEDANEDQITPRVEEEAKLAKLEREMSMRD